MPAATRAPADTRPFLRYGGLLAVLLAGYLFLDRAFAYVHVPGLPIFVGEAVLAVGLLAAARHTRAFVTPVAAEPVLALLVAFMLWGAVRTLPGIPAYGLDAPRDGALWYYGLFALLATAAVTARPELPGHLAGQLDRVAPALLVWLCASLLLAPVAPYAPTVPFTDTSVLSHKPGGAAVAALLVLTVLWLLPGDRSRRSRALWSIVALLVVALAGTQNRGGLLGVLAGGAVALLFLEDRVRVLARSALVLGLGLGLGLGLAVLLAVRIPFAGLQGREYSATQLTTNLVSLTGAETSGNLAGTVDGRHELWTRVLAKQVREDRVLDGTGFGPNLAADVGILDDGEESLRNPHNTHLHVFNRTGALGSLLWALFWAGWYWRVAAACRRLRGGGRHRDRQVAGVCLATTTAILVSTAFDPLLESPQAAALTWSLVGIGLVVTRGRP